MTTKKILMISYHTCPLASEEGKETGGMNIYVLELSKQLALLGNHVDVITRSQDSSSEKIVQVSPNFRVIHLYAGPEISVSKKEIIQYIPEFIQSFNKFSGMDPVPYDVIHAHYYLSGIIGLEIQKLSRRKIPLIMTFHTLALMKNLVARSQGEQESQSRIDAEFMLSQNADAVITPSESDKQYIEYLYGTNKEKIYEIPPGVNSSLFQPMNKIDAKKHIGVDNTSKIILFVGRIEPLKGIDVLLYALKIILSQKFNIPISLLIVGGDVSQHITKWSPLHAQLEQLRHTLHITSQVKFIGQRTQNELRYYYNAADIVVMPSHYESFGMAAAEAMACGIPVITTNATGISNLIDERRSAVVTSVSNPLLLASQIKKLLTDENLYKQVSENSIENVSDLTWDNISKRITDTYEKVIMNTKI